MRKLALAAAIVLGAGVAQGQTVFTVNMDGAQDGTPSLATGSGTVTLNAAETQITLNITHNIPNASTTMGHIHQGAFGVAGGIIFTFAGNGDSPITDTFSLSPAQVQTLKQGLYYVNVHTVAFTGGEIRGQVNPPQDSDGDGLLDGVETDTGTYVSPNNTGSDPNDADSDDDGVNDGVEVSLGTNPNNNLDLPNVPVQTAWLLAGVVAVAMMGMGAFVWQRRRRRA